MGKGKSLLLAFVYLFVYFNVYQYVHFSSVSVLMNVEANQPASGETHLKSLKSFKSFVSNKHAVAGSFTDRVDGSLVVTKWLPGSSDSCKSVPVLGSQA